MALPHNFSSLVEEPTIQSVFIVGTGLSTPTAPTVGELKSKLDKVAESLGVVPNADFYVLAENVLENIKISGKTDAESRMWLAEKLGLLDDRRWFGETGLPLSGNTPRHRVIARFAVENRLKAIVSLNWDTLLEAALDSVGMADGVMSSRPWGITAHATVIDDSHMPELQKANVFPVFKPHGCVRNLEQARRLLRSTGVSPPSITFKLTQSELDNLPAGQTQVDRQVQGYIAQCPLVAVGWKASEGYLRNTVVNTACAVQHSEIDSFTLVSRSWYPNEKCSDTFHDDIAVAYNKTKLGSFAAVGNSGEPTLDCLFLWLQARYALNKLIVVASIPHKTELRLLLQQIELPNLDHPVLGWIDSWLPTWVRLCWRSGAMQGIDPHTNKRIDPWDIPIIPRDVHVPFGGMTLERRELRAAAKLLAILGNSFSQFDFEKFPGGFWDKEARKLYIPLPGWADEPNSADLAALKPLVEALRGLGFVRNIHLVWLDSESTPPNLTHCKQLSAQVSRLMPLTNFATADALTWIDLETLKGGNDEVAA